MVILPLSRGRVRYARTNAERMESSRGDLKAHERDLTLGITGERGP